MNPFQIVALTLMCGLTGWEVWKFSSRSTPWPPLARIAVWLIAMALIYEPETASRVARMVGIGRGADLALYCASLGLLMCVFMLYSRQVSFERRLTDLVRHQALQEAQRGRKRVIPGEDL